VTDAQSRSGTGNISLTATAAPTGGCCVTGECEIRTAYNCAQGGGTYNGNGSDCAGTFTQAGSSGDAFPMTIPDAITSGSVPGSATATLTMPAGSGTITNLAVSVGINHTYVGDIHMSLSNGTTTVSLAYRPGVTNQANETGASCNYGGTYLFADASVNDIWAATTTQGSGYVLPSGTFHPAGINSPSLPTPSLSAFSGQSFEGTWTLTVEDWWGLDTGSITSFTLGTITPTSCGPTCGTSDFNGDGDFGTDQDIEAFFACLAGQCCATCFPGGSDFNGDGDFGTDQDIESFFRVLAGGNC
jgi:subtilisin-like proprotein convertase family protein